MNKKHGYTKTHKKLYHVWHAMKKRCNDKENKNYGGRGISYCEEWENAEVFCEWALQNGYADGLELDRIDNDGNYEPSNCRWVDRKTNAQNQRRATILSVNGKEKCVSEWERELGVGKNAINSWVNRWGKAFAENRIAEILETGTYKRYRKNGVRTLLKGVQNE